MSKLKKFAHFSWLIPHSKWYDVGKKRSKNVMQVCPQHIRIRNELEKVAEALGEK